MSKDEEIKGYIEKRLKKNRPNIRDATRRTYVSLLATIYRNMANEEDDIESFFCDNYDEVIEYVKENYPKATAIKTRMAALVSLCGDEEENAVKKYRESMTENSLKDRKMIETQEKTETQAENWVSYDEIKEKLELLRNRTNAILKLNKNEYTMQEMQQVQEYVILSLYVLIPPRRLMDYIMMKYVDYDEEKDNYVDFKNKKLVFNVYKTAWKYKNQKEDLPDRLEKILKKWIKIIDGRSEYLLFDRNFDKLSQSQLQQRLNKIFGNKKVSVNIIRHSYLSNKYGSGPSLEERRRDAEAMGHSLEEQLEYIKK